MVIVGTGIVGAATAYYLSCASGGKTPITLLDAAGPASASSGRAGAFLTNHPPSFRRGIGDGEKVSDKRRLLFEKSFELHQKLANELNLDSFCRVQNYQTIESKEIESTDYDILHDDDNQQSILSHLTRDGRGTSLPGDAALVNPAELVASMIDKVLSQPNSSFRQASMVGLEIDDSKSFVTGIRLETGDGGHSVLSVDEDEPIVIALGPWTARIEDWLGIPMPIEGVLSTSLVYQDGISEEDVGTAFFFDDDSNGCHLEVFGRQDKSLYVSGCGESQVIGTALLRSDDRPSPKVPCVADSARAQAAQTSLQKAGYSTGASPNVIQACIRPMSPDGVPVVGKLLDNIYVGTGGGPWGITWGPLMGQSLACLIQNDNDGDEDPPIRLGPLSPKRFDTFVYKSLLKSRKSSS